MNFNKIFHKVPVDIQNRSGFDLSHSNLTSLKTGTLVPVLVDQLIPGDNISLGHLTEVQLPPMLDFYGRVEFKLEAFFVPNRLCYGGFQNFVTQPTDNRSSSGNYIANVKYLPCANVPLSLAGPGSLVDYLGFKMNGLNSPDGFLINNILPAVAYHLIWQDWYRDSLIQKECFNMAVGSSTSGPGADGTAQYLPFVTFQGSSPRVIDPTLADGRSLFSLRQRCWSKDYFTNAKVNPQAGTPAALSFSVTDNAGSFTIASLRAANTLQKWMERQNLAGARYIDQIKANYGVTPSDAVLNRPVYLGSHSFDIYNKSVYQTGANDDSRNPVNSVAAKFSSPLGVSDSSLVDNFSVTEFGFLFVIASIVPEALYSSGQRRYLDYSVFSDFANPILAAVGDQAIKKKELSIGGLNSDGTFGYSQRYSEYKFMLNEVHGELVDGRSLSSLALQRSFPSIEPSLSSSFIEIPTDYLDQVTAVESSSSNLGAWCNSWFSYKKSSVLPAYSIPTLGDTKDTHTEVINNGGTRL